MDAENVRIAVDGIKIVSDDVDDSEAFLSARKLIQDAEIIFILGFSYHALSMKRLALPFETKPIVGTANATASGDS